MRATAHVVAEAGPAGVTRLTVVRGEPPLLVRRTGAGEVHLVGGAAGPLGGDRLRIEIEVGPGAELCVRTVAASIALPGRDGAESRTEVVATVAPGGRLAWLPEPLIAAAGCRHAALTTVELAAGARLTWRDELVCGRHGEEPGEVRTRLAVRLAGRPLYAHELAIGPGAPGWAGAAVLGGARAVGSLVVVDPSVSIDPSYVLGPTAAVLPLAGPGVLVTATGADLRQVRSALERVRPALEARTAGPGHRQG
ncbi:MAG TPA: urease accessory protein UreD [Planosporangium sp.]|jgi:urease accessory protein|nr:urease accessory protein UreD [Planosporangium sp.]